MIVEEFTNIFLGLQRKIVVNVLKLRYNQYDKGGRLC